MNGDVFARLYEQRGYAALAIDLWLGSRIGATVGAAIQGPVFQGRRKANPMAPAPAPALPSPQILPFSWPRMAFSATVYTPG